MKGLINEPLPLGVAIEHGTGNETVMITGLANGIELSLGARSGPPDFARIFQAIRIAVNDELEGLERALPAFRDALVPGGRIAAISYHSGEDRVAKQLFQEWARACICPPSQPFCTCRGKALGTLVPRKPILPGTLLLGTQLRLALELARDLVEPPPGSRLAVSRVMDMKLRRIVPPGGVATLALAVQSHTAGSTLLTLDASIGHKPAGSARAEVTLRGAP
jgi:hypothetical protein